jgi:hypothetical protein
LSQWKAGFAKRKITPPLGVALAGYGLMPGRVATTIADDLFARAVVFDDGSSRVALASVDSAGLSADLINSIRQRVRKSCDIPPEAIMISATHSHSAPTAQFLRQWGALDPVYIQALEQNIADALIEAAKETREATVGFSEISVSGIAVNRVHKGGPADDKLRILAVQQQGKVSAALAHFSCHPVHLRPESTEVSADFPGALVAALERDAGVEHALFLQGNLGDINPATTHTSLQNAVGSGEKLAQAAAGALKAIDTSAGACVGFAREYCELPLDLEDARNEAVDYLFKGKVRKLHEYLAARGFMRAWAVEMLGLLAANPPATVTVEISAIRIGEGVIVGLPGEVYTLMGQQIRVASHFKHTWIASFANGYYGYFTPPDDYDESIPVAAAGGGAYAAYMAPKIFGLPPYKPAAWQVLNSTATLLLQRI